MDACFGGLKVISCWEEGRRKREFQSLDAIGISVRSIGIQFKRVGVLENRV